jgi:hypothetical protein
MQHNHQLPGIRISRKEQKNICGGLTGPRYQKWNCTNGTITFPICWYRDPFIDGCDGGYPGMTCTLIGSCNQLICA